MQLVSITLGDSHQYEKFKYPAGEMQVRLKENAQKEISQAELVTVTARMRTAEDLIETCLLVNAVRCESVLGKNSAGHAGPKDDASPDENGENAGDGAIDGRGDGNGEKNKGKDKLKKVVLILPYLPYGRADRRFVNGDCFGLEVFANILNSLNVSVMTLDAHSDKSLALIERFTDIPPTPLIEKAIRHNLTANDSCVPTLLFPDDGARKRYASIAAGLHADVLHCQKVRDKATGKLSHFSVPAREEFKTTNVLLIDDICDGGGTFLGIADALKDYGFRLSLYVTHGVFSHGLEPLLKRFETMYTTDSFSTELAHPQLIDYPTAHLFEGAAMLQMREKIGERV